MILLIAIVIGLSQLAKRKGLNPLLWGVFALLGCFGVPFIAGIFIGIFNPDFFGERRWN